MLRKSPSNILSYLVFLSVTLFFSLGVHAKDLGYLPVQDGGRYKPYDTFAKESLYLVWGKEKYKGRLAVDVVTSWLLVPDEWEKTQFIQVRHSGLRDALRLDERRIHYSPEELMTNPRVGLLIQDLRSKQETEEKLDPFFQAVQTLENQITMFRAVQLGLALRVWPNPESENQAWHNMTQLEGEAHELFEALMKSFVARISAKGRGDSEGLEQANKSISQNLEAFTSAAREKFGSDYATDARINAEVHYNRFHPFMWSWIAYLGASIFFAFAMFGSSPTHSKIGWAMMFVGFFLHTYGFGLRVYISGRAPVTNMYETVLWVAWGSVFLSAIVYYFYRTKMLPLAAAIVATFSLILCDLSSHVLDGSISPLEPVLRDNFWLITHVLIITLSYAAFFLAFVIGDLALVYFLKGEERYKEKIKQASMAMYRSIQIGVVLLAAGTILGGIWADYSWGRFWGWDPKETWALIALLGYIAILHGRLAGWLKDFGLAVTSVLCFSLVIMAWYGVNFVLGAGFHTYGFGAGGVEYVSAFVALHILYVVFVITLRQSRLKSQQKNSK